jgi:hypothetical protein
VVEQILVRVVVNHGTYRRGQVLTVDATDDVLALVERGYLDPMGPAHAAPVVEIEPEIVIHDPGASAPRVVRPGRG